MAQKFKIDIAKGTKLRAFLIRYDFDVAILSHFSFIGRFPFQFITTIKRYITHYYSFFISIECSKNMLIQFLKGT